VLYSRIHALLPLVLVALVLAIAPDYAAAQPFSNNLNDGDGTPTPTQKSGGEHQIYQNVNRIYSAAGLGSPFLNNQGLDPFYATTDHPWVDLNGTISLIGIAAGHSNKFGTYSNLGTGDGKTQLFAPGGGQDFQGAGTLIDPFPAKLATAGQTSPAGFYLHDTTSGDIWYSDPALNSDQYDHMISYRLTALAGKTIHVNTGSGVQAITLHDPYLIAWEDLKIAQSDEDYNDMVLLVDKACLVPLPGSFILFGMGFGGLGLSALRRRLRSLRAAAL